MVMMDGIDQSAATQVTPGQIRAARALLGWSQHEAAIACGLGVATLARLERRQVESESSTIAAVMEAFEAHGIVFISQGDLLGVALAPSVTSDQPK